MSKFSERRAARRQAKAEREERTDNLRDWFEKRREASKARAKAERADRNAKPRGVDRVPDHLRFGRTIEQDIIHADNGDDNYKSRRASAKRFRVRDNLGHIEKVRVRPGVNTPYYNPKRDKR